MTGSLTMHAIGSSYAFTHYANMLNTAAPGAIANAAMAGASSLAVGAGSSLQRIVYVQTQGYMPSTRLSGNEGLPPEERGWVKTGTDTGGQTFYALNEARALADLGKDVTLIAQRFNGSPEFLQWYRNHETGGRVNIIRVPAGGIVPGKETYPFVPKEELYPHLRGMSHDVAAIATLIGAQAIIGGYADGGTIATVVGELLGIPNAFIAHSLGAAKLRRMGYDPRNPAHLYDHYHFGDRIMAERLAFLSASAVFSNTPEEATALQQYYGVKGVADMQITMQPAGVDEVFFRAAKGRLDRTSLNNASHIMQERGLKPGKFFMSWGRISPAKNIPGQIRVLAELKRQFPEEYRDVKLLIVGGDPARATGEELEVKNEILETIRECGMQYGNDVVRVGNMSYSMIAALAKNAIAYLGTQRLEPFGMAAAEMLALKSNGFVIIPHVSGLAQWLNQMGAGDVIVSTNLDAEPNSSRIPQERFAEAARQIHRFRSDPRRVKAVIAAGGKIADRHLHWSAIAEEKLEALTKIAREMGSRPAGQRPSRFIQAALPAWRGSADVVKTDVKGRMTDAYAAAALRIARMVEQKFPLNGASQRRIISIAGDEASKLANIVAAALNDDTWRVARIAGSALRFFSGDEIASITDTGVSELHSNGRALFLNGARYVVVDNADLKGVTPDLDIVVTDPSHIVMFAENPSSAKEADRPDTDQRPRPQVLLRLVSGDN